MRKAPTGPPAGPQPTASEIQAKEKLMHYVYEYLIHNNFTKSAECFKTEVLPNVSVQVSEAPGFLTTWFNLFWDLYSGDPERRDKCNPTQEAKAFHEYGFVHGSQLNGIRPPGGFMGPPGMPMPGPGPDGMMTPFFRPGNMQNPHYGNTRPPQGFPPPAGPAPHMFPNPNDQMRGMQQQQRLRMPGPPQQMNFRPQGPRYGGPYMESPTSNPGFPQIPNGGAQMSQPHEIQHDLRFMQMGGPATSVPQFMGGEMQPSMTPTTSVPNSMGIGQMPPPEVNHTGANLPPLSAAPLANIMNGEELKQSPSHMMHPPNGTPGSAQPGSQHQMIGHGPGSAAGPAPPSVQSQPGQPGSNIPVTQPQPPISMAQGQMMEHSIMEFSDNQSSNSHEDLTEIKKIREGLLDDFNLPGDAANNQ